MPHDERNDIASIDITTISDPTIPSDSINMITPYNLNPLAKIFTRGRVNDIDVHKEENMMNTNTIVKSDELRKRKELWIITSMSFILILCSYIVYAISTNTFVPKISGARSNINPEDTMNILREIRIKNVNRVIIGTLNINSLSSKFEQLKLIMGNYIDVLVIQETKLDPSFSDGQFVINGYKKPYRLDRNRNGGGVIIYVREDIPSKLLDKHTFTQNIEGLSKLT